MTEAPGRYDVTVTVGRDDGHFPGPAEFAVAAGQAASGRNASVVSAHSADRIICVVTVETADQSAAVAAALAVVSEALGRPVASCQGTDNAKRPAGQADGPPRSIETRDVAG